MEPLLEVRDLHKRFVLHAIDGREKVALRGVDLTVAAGSHVALAGTSGAGKSSLLKCVHRTYIPDRGSVVFRRGSGEIVDLATADERLVVDLRRREIGYVSQFLRAEPRRSVHATVSRAARRRGMAPDVADDAAAATLRRLELDEGLWGTYPTLLSGGEKQRVNLAAGIVVPPRLLLLDEPVASLDPSTADAALDAVDELRSAGVAVLSVFHDLAAITRLADVVVVLTGGRVTATGTPDEVLPSLAEVAGAGVGAVAVTGPGDPSASGDHR